MTVTLIVGLGRTFAMTSFRVSQYTSEEYDASCRRHLVS